MHPTPKLALAFVSFLAVSAVVVVPHAQSGAQKVAYVDSQALLMKTAAGKELNALNTKATAELAPLEKQIREIDAKGNAATGAEREKRNQLLGTYQAKQQSYAKQIEPKAKAATDIVDAAVAKFSKTNGIALILEANVSRDSGLIVYADKALDLTDEIGSTIK